MNDNNIKISFKSFYGCYAWCGNNYNDQTSGYYLSPTVINSENPMKKAEYKTIIKFLIEIGEDVNITDVDIIEFHAETDGFLLKYTTEPILYKNELVVALKEQYAGTICSVHFRKFKEIPARFIGRRPMETIYQKKIILPKLHVIDVEQDCSICLDPLQIDNCLITQCNHNFHLSCLWKNFEFNKLLLEKNAICIRFGCSHDKKIKLFLCPMCRSIVDC